MTELSAEWFTINLVAPVTRGCVYRPWPYEQARSTQLTVFKMMDRCGGFSTFQDAMGSYFRPNCFS